MPTYTHIPEYQDSPITAYRWMATELYFMRLHAFRSILYPHDWTRGWNLSRPCDGWWPGFFSFKTAELAISQDRVADLVLYDYNVLVQISICGNVHEHELGYRSEYARIEKIVGWGCHVNGRMIRELRDRYDIDVARVNAVDGKKAAIFFGLIPLWRR